MSAATAVAERTPADHARFEMLWSRYHAPVRQWLTKMSGSRTVADDLAGEAFVRVWRNLHKLYSSEDDPRGQANWVWRIARTVLYDHHKAVWTHRVDLVDTLPVDVPLAPSAEAVVLAAVASEELVSDLLDALDDLSPEQRDVVLAILGERTSGQVAAETGRNVNAVKTQLHRGRRQLRKRLTSHTTDLAEVA